MSKNKEFKLVLLSTESVARAWAAMDGKEKLFDDCMSNAALEEEKGCYEGYLSDANELLKRAIKNRT